MLSKSDPELFNAQQHSLSMLKTFPKPQAINEQLALAYQLKKTEELLTCFDEKTKR